jgi:hypothetical protein
MSSLITVLCFGMSSLLLAEEVTLRTAATRPSTVQRILQANTAFSLCLPQMECINPDFTIQSTASSQACANACIAKSSYVRYMSRNARGANLGRCYCYDNCYVPTESYSYDIYQLGTVQSIRSFNRYCYNNADFIFFL